MTLSPSPPLGHPATAALLKIAYSITNFARALRHRREIMYLAEFDDRMLKDIGLSRSDVDGALTESFFYNPSVVLVRRAERHTRAERLAPLPQKARPVVPTVREAGRYA